MTFSLWKCIILKRKKERKKKEGELDVFSSLLKTYTLTEQISQRRECSVASFHPLFNILILVDEISISQNLSLVT